MRRTGWELQSSLAALLALGAWPVLGPAPTAREPETWDVRRVADLATPCTSSASPSPSQTETEGQMAPSSPPSQQPPSDDSPAGPGIASPAQALTSYRARPDVEYAEPDYIVRVGSPGQEACGDQ